MRFLLLLISSMKFSVVAYKCDERVGDADYFRGVKERITTK